MHTTNTINKPLAGRKALVTGGARGIGAAIVKRLAGDGASVAFTYVSAQSKAEELVQEIKSAGGQALAIRADSADFGALKGAVEETIQSFGGIDILVNNAGITSLKPYDQFTLEEFDQLVAVNLKAVFVAVQAAAPQMKPGGRVINIGSVAAEFNPFPGNSLYVSTKAAVAGLTRALARDLAPQGITVNNIQPGMIDTDMNPENGPYASGTQMIPLGRYGKASEIASMVAYISSPEAGYITGASMNIDGGGSV
ncbi:3-oxoacyl-ACP reductase family protein [Paenibacillus sp. VCA1]|uniref:3-oxoacyl-ACP reductase family protein n=1 Tax=Paenibacillus sp. VCA1 TaxID=3039148 RepID=UPI00287115EF|nr:3-oxoacyl-ACP reductase family protein [Paenibacillus sp. VCA1]MDR9852543.1 3-oxoacyl-ACP reductase family protein [Paenibacillus sp. VCA1]